MSIHALDPLAEASGNHAGPSDLFDHSQSLTTTSRSRLLNDGPSGLSEIAISQAWHQISVFWHDVAPDKSGLPPHSKSVARFAGAFGFSDWLLGFLPTSRDSPQKL